MSAAKRDLIVIGGGPAGEKGASPGRILRQTRGDVIGDDAGFLKLIYSAQDTSLGREQATASAGTLELILTTLRFMEVI